MKTVRSFITNNLVEGHDTYVKFMNERAENLKKDGKKSDFPVLFYKKGFGGSTGERKATTIERRDICKWHCITLTYNIWCELVKDHVMPDNSCTQYKKHIDVSDDILKQFKYRVEQAIKIAGCDYNKVLSPSSRKSGTYDVCRYLAMYWTYLDIIHDCKTQRYFPNGTTIIRAQRVFGYELHSNPFFMNGKFHKNAIRSKKETKEVKSDTTNCIMVEDLDFTHRTFNILKRACINTLDDILKRSYNDLIKIRDMGKQSLNEIVEALRKQGYEYVDCDKVPQPIEVQINYPRNKDGYDNNMLLVDIIEDRRLTNPLHRASIHTVGDFLGKSDKELLKIRTFGAVKLKKVREVIDNYIKQNKEESVIDIAEQAAKEVAEERKGIDISEKTAKNGDKYLHVNVDNNKRINELLAQQEIDKAIIEEYKHQIYAAKTIAEKYDKLLSEKTELEANNAKLKFEIDNLNVRMEELKMSTVKESTDILDTIGKAITLMKNAGITTIKTDIRGYCIDIQQKWITSRGM